MMRTVAMSLAAVHMSISMAQDCAATKDKDSCKGLKGCKWSKTLSVCYVAAEGRPDDTPFPTYPETAATPIPTSEPTLPPTDSPTAAPTEAPTATPTEAPTGAPTTVSTVPSGPFEQADCGAIGTKSQCNRTPTCVYQNLNEKCAGCPDVASRNSCENTIGCAWRQKACAADDTVPHPDDDKCVVHHTKRHCRNMPRCQWNRNNTCSGNRGCATQKNSIDCRAAYQCYWLPNQRECVDSETVENA